MRYRPLYRAVKALGRTFSNCGNSSESKGLVLGAYQTCHNGQLQLTETATRFDNGVDRKLSKLLKGAGVEKGKAQVFGNLGPEFFQVAVAGLGLSGLSGLDPKENLYVYRENVRVAAAAGAKALQERGVSCMMLEGFDDPESAAEGAKLGTWNYQDLKKKEDRLPPARIELYDSSDRGAWIRGVVKAEAQNFARRLEEVPANLMTPSTLGQTAVEALSPYGVGVEVHAADWIEDKGMSAFLTVARGSSESPLFLELKYFAGGLHSRPFVFIGKGVTFDSGGIDLKECEGMEEFRGDMAGAAVVLGLFRAVAEMGLPLNLIGLIPLCENTVGGLAMKPGDVVLGMNGKTIRLENTDNEGRVILADAIVYAGSYKPSLVVDIADLTTGLKRAVGGACSGVFSNSDEVWKELRLAGAVSGDRFWRFPLWKHFTTRVTDYVGVDVHNVGKGKGGDPCLGAAFLMEFLPPVDFAHIDISGSGLRSNGLDQPYLKKGLMSGRPTRGLIQFLLQLTCPHSVPPETC